MGRQMAVPIRRSSRWGGKAERPKRECGQGTTKRGFGALHRFIGTRSGRKSQYARLLAGVVDLARVPRPLDRVLTAI